MRKGGIAQGVTLAGLILMLSLLQGIFFRSTLELMNGHTIILISQMMGKLLEHAHRLNDDLTMQKTVQSLSQGSGVIFAAVLDNDKKVIAHSDPSMLGKSYEQYLKRIPRSSYSILPLKEAAQLWGYFLFALSRRPLRQKTNEQWGLLLGGDILLMLGVLWLWMQWRTRYIQAMSQVQDLKQQQLEADTHHKELLVKHNNLIEISAQQIQDAIELLPQATLFLGPTQRVIASNKSAKTQWDALKDYSYADCSWQNIPQLENCGETLQRSLENPGQRFEYQNATTQTTICFLSQYTPHNRLTGTWVYF